MRARVPAPLRCLGAVRRGGGGVRAQCFSRRSWLALGLVFVVLAAVAARATHPHVRLAALPIFCDGIDDEERGSLWIMVKTKNDEAKAHFEMRMLTIRREPRVAPVYARASDQRDEVVRFFSRPRLFTARAPTDSDSANPD
jgi:hypothetical protein